MVHPPSSIVGLCPPVVRRLPRLGPLQPHRHIFFCGTNPFCAPRPLHHRPIRGTLEPGHQGGVPP